MSGQGGQTTQCSLNAKGYLFALNSSLAFAVCSFVIIIILVFGPIYNHTYPNNNVYYILLFQIGLFIASMVAIIGITVSNRPEAVALCWKSKKNFDRNKYMTQRGILISIIVLFAIGEAAALGGVIWRLVIYTDCMNQAVTDPCRTGANGTLALVLAIFDVVSLVPPIGIFISCPFAWKFLEALNNSGKRKSVPRDENMDFNQDEVEGEEEEEKTSANSRFDEAYPLFSSTSSRYKHWK